MSLVFRANALKVVNKNPGGSGDAKRSDYVTYICPNPRCGHRNKQSMYEAENYVPSAESWIPFKCKMCRSIVEVTPPYKGEPLIMTPDVYTQQMAQRRRDLAVNSPIMGRS